MLKIYMNDPFSTDHEFAQAKRLVNLLSEAYADPKSAWLCLNFSVGGKSLDAMLITEERLTILELKAVGGNVSCQTSFENAPWVWKPTAYSRKVHSVQTEPYTNPFNQAKSYRTAVAKSLSQNLRRFANLERLPSPIRDFPLIHWIKCCVLLSHRDASDVEVSIGEATEGVSRWFTAGTLGDVVELTSRMASDVTFSPEEIDRLIQRVLGVFPVKSLLELWEAPKPSAAVIAQESLSEAPPLRNISSGDGFDVVPTSPPTEDEPFHSQATNKNSEDVDRIYKSLLGAKNPVNTPSTTGVAHTNVVASKESINCGYQCVQLAKEMSFVAPGYGSLQDLEGERAVDAVLESCPDIGNFEVKKVLRFGPGVSADQREEVLNHFAQKYVTSRPWHCVGYAKGYVDFIFGKPLASAPIVPLAQDPNAFRRPVSGSFLLARWIQTSLEKESEGLPTIDPKPCTKLIGHSSDEVRQYAMTHLPVACAEAFVLTDWILGNVQIPKKVTVLDVGCDSGGASLGCLLALHKHASEGLHEIQIEGVDCCENALAYCERLFRRASANFVNRTLRFVPQKVTQLADLTNLSCYDLVIASRAIEVFSRLIGSNDFAQSLELIASQMNARGLLVAIDQPNNLNKLHQAVEQVTSRGFVGWTKQLSLAQSGGDCPWNYSCACLSRRESGS